MFSSCRFVFEKVFFSTLFQHNYVLEKVFSAPAQKVAIVTEPPVSASIRSYTYGQLQRDVISLSNLIVERKVTVHRGSAEDAKQGKQSDNATVDELLRKWCQPRREADVQSIFSHLSGRPSCDVLHDTGTYVSAILGGSGYEFVVSILACWTLNLMAVPMSISQTYPKELTYILEHSGATTIMGEAHAVEEKFPACYDSIRVRSMKEVHRRPPASAHNTYHVDSCVELSPLFLAELNQGLSPYILSADPSSMSDTVDVLDVEKSEEEPIRTAKDVEARLEELKAKQVRDKIAHQVETSEESFERRRHTLREKEEEDLLPLQFDSEHASSALNPVLLRWYQDPSTRPTDKDDCVMIYTSGTTAQPKGAVHSHASIQNQVQCLQDAWRWSSNDVVIHLLPLHHIHGLVNVLLCSLASHARCVFHRFDPIQTPKRIEQGDITVVMAVPTIYNKMIASVNSKFSAIEKSSFRAACESRVRLMVSGSAALPVPTLNQFYEISGHILLERYGMTEIGMGLSQPLLPLTDRLPGTVGVPLPTVMAWVEAGGDEGEDAHRTDTNGPADDEYTKVGPLRIASASLFDRYWKNPTATRKELRVHPETGKRYFDTGDVAGVKPLKEGDTACPVVYTILGRSSVDIIKCGGYKLSALEIEAALLSRKELFFEIAVVNCKDEVYGEIPVAIIVMVPEAQSRWNMSFSGARYIETKEYTDKMNQIAKDLLSPYKRPRRYLFVPEIERNPTGKVNKKNLKEKMGLE